MAPPNVTDYLDLLPAVFRSPHRYIRSSYDAEADVVYVNFKKPAHATDSELTDDDLIIRYEDDEIVGITILTPANADPDSAVSQAGRTGSS